jgi:putative endonuclease
MRHGGFVYMVTNQYNTVLYAGVTSELRARVFEHKTKFYPKSFTANIIAIRSFGLNFYRI